MSIQICLLEDGNCPNHRRENISRYTTLAVLCNSQSTYVCTDINLDFSSMLDKSNHSDQLFVRSSMTGREFAIHRSEVSQLLGNYISQSDIDPSLADAPIMAK